MLKNNITERPTESKKPFVIPSVTVNMNANANDRKSFFERFQRNLNSSISTKPATAQIMIIAITNFGTNAIKLMRESRMEIRKVVWPTRMETTQTFMIVFAAIIILCLFFWGLESLLSYLTGLALG